MRIKCNPDDSPSSDGSEVVAASCVDYQTLGISRMRNANISTEIIGDLEPGACHLKSPLDYIHPKFVTTMAHDFVDEASVVPGSKNFKPNSLEFKRNFSQPDMRKSSLDAPLHDSLKNNNRAKERTHEKFYSRVNSPEIDQVDGGIIGGNVILGDYETEVDKKSYFPSYEDFARNNKKLKEEEKNDKANENKVENSSDVGDTELENRGEGKPYALATLDGTIMLVKDEIILW